MDVLLLLQYAQPNFAGCSIDAQPAKLGYAYCRVDQNYHLMEICFKFWFLWKYYASKLELKKYIFALYYRYFVYVSKYNMTTIISNLY